MAEDKLQFLKDPQLRKSIIASTIATIIVLIFIKPILSYLWTIILFISSHFYKGFIDTIYENAALGHRNYGDLMIMLFLFGLASGSVLAGAAKMTKSFFSLKKSVQMKKRKNRLLN